MREDIIATLKPRHLSARVNETATNWRFERDSFFADQLKGRSVRQDSRAALAAWASRDCRRSYEELMSTGTPNRLDAVLVTHDSDKSAMSDLGHVVVRLGLTRRKLG